jgi:hypothetical protein
VVVSAGVSIEEMGFENPCSIPLSEGTGTVVEVIKRIGTENLFRIQTVFQRFCKELAESSRLALAVTGSDARLERTGSFTNVEFILVVPPGTGPSSVALEETVRKIKTYIAGQKRFFPEVEEKKLSCDAVSLFTCSAQKGGGIVEKPIITRALDARFVAGDQTVFIEYKNQFQREIIAANDTSSTQGEKKVKLSEFVKDFLKPAIREIEVELGCFHNQQPKEARPVGIQAGVLTEDGRYTKGPKYGILRSIQYVVALAIARHAGKIGNFSEIPSFIPERIDWLFSRKIIPLTTDEKGEMQACYRQALEWYWRLEAEVEKSKQLNGLRFAFPVSITVDPSLAKQVLETTYALVRKIMSTGTL